MEFACPGQFLPSASVPCAYFSLRSGALNYEFAPAIKKERADPHGLRENLINLDDFGIKVAYDGMPFWDRPDWTLALFLLRVIKGAASDS